jgi:hypothetical protein
MDFRESFKKIFEPELIAEIERRATSLHFKEGDTFSILVKPFALSLLL